jgi:hypothetical protein
MKLAASAPAVVMIGLSAIMVADTLPMGVWDGFAPGAAFFPLLIATFATVLSAVVVAKVVTGEPEAPSWPDAAGLRNIVLVYAALIGFVVLAPVVGMLPAAAGLLAFTTIAVLRQPLLGGLAAVAITTGLIYLVFVRWLALPLPVGPLGF